MHPILTRPERLALYTGAWLVLGALVAATLSRQGLSLPEALVLVVPLFLVHSFISLSAWYVCRAVPLRTSGLLRVAGSAALAASVACGLWLGVAMFWIEGFAAISGFAATAERYRQQLPVLFAAAVLLFLLALAVNYLGLTFEEARQAEQRHLESQMHARNAELRALRAQIDPHFLYNCLNSIAALTSTDAAGARRMCLLLGEFLRSTLHVGALSRISLADELALADRFLAIEQVRFDSRLQVARSVDESVLGARVPPLFLQPLVENAVRHGIANLLDGGTIRIALTRRGDQLSISIENPCDPEAMTPMRHGTGLSNVRERLVALYGASATLSARAHAGCFRVELTLPLSPGD